MQQLSYSGVLEVVRIRKEGYPVRQSFTDFLTEQPLLCNELKFPNPLPRDLNTEQARLLATQLCEAFLPASNYPGAMRVFQVRSVTQ